MALRVKVSHEKLTTLVSIDFLHVEYNVFNLLEDLIYHFIEGSCTFTGRSSLWYSNTLISFLTISIVKVEI